MIPIIIDQLTCFEYRIEKYFHSVNVENIDWISNTFVNFTITNPISLELHEEGKLADISAIVVSC